MFGPQDLCPISSVILRTGSDKIFKQLYQASISQVSFKVVYIEALPVLEAESILGALAFTAAAAPLQFRVDGKGEVRQEIEAWEASGIAHEINQ